MAPTKVKRDRSLVSSNTGVEAAGSPKNLPRGSKRFFSFKREIAIEPEGARSLKEVDSGKLKAEIMRWAKRVASYARQVSGRIGRSMTMSSRTSSGVRNDHCLKMKPGVDLSNAEKRVHGIKKKGKGWVTKERSRPKPLSC